MNHRENSENHNMKIRTMKITFMMTNLKTNFLKIQIKI